MWVAVAGLPGCVGVTMVDLLCAGNRKTNESISLPLASQSLLRTALYPCLSRLGRCLSPWVSACTTVGVVVCL